MPADYKVTREQVAEAVRLGKEFLLQDQITPETKTYDTFEETTPGSKAGRWIDAPLARHLVGGFCANLWRNPRGSSRDGECRRQYHSTWHTAQCAVALMDHQEFHPEPAVQRAIDLTWDFIRRHQVPDGEFKGVFVERELKDLHFPLQDYHSFSTQNRKADDGYASYDNIETDLFPLELYRRAGNQEALQVARDNALYHLRHHADRVFFEVETRTFSISGLDNDAIYGRLAKYTGDPEFRETYIRQVRRLNLLGLDLRAGNNVRNMYWDVTGVLYAVDEFPEARSAAIAQLAFLSEHLLAAQKDNGVLWHRFKEPGLPDTECHQDHDGAATNGAIQGWAKMYDLTGDPRWLQAIRKAVHYAIANQYPADDHPCFAGAFEYAGWMEMDGSRYEMLRAVSTAFALRALIPLLAGGPRWAEDFWK